MKIGSSKNSSLQIARALALSSTAIARQLRELASGSREGLSAVSTSIESKLREIKATRANQQLEVSRNQVESQGLEAQLSIIGRMRELATQSTNSLLSSSDRDKINSEIQSLRSEFDRIADQTEFNGHRLLANSRSNNLVKENQNSMRFEAAQTIARGYLNQGSYGDLDQDGDLDLYYTSFGFDPFSAINQSPSRKFGLKQVATGLSSEFADHVFADINNDGILDSLLANGTGGPLSTAFGRGDGTFESYISYQVNGTDFTGLSLGDYNSDGSIDVSVRDMDTREIEVFINDGNGHFDHSQSISSTDIMDHESVDFNEDGHVDLVWLTQEFVFVLFGDGSGSFGSSTQVSFGDPFTSSGASLSLDDFDQDGDLDAIVEAANIDTFIHLSNENGTLVSQSELYATSQSSGSRSILLRDLNRDGLQDAVGILANGRAEYWLNNGGSFNGSPSGEITGLSASNLIDMVDLDNDGVLDLLTQSNLGYAEIRYGIGSLRSNSSLFNADSPETAMRLDQTLMNAQNEILSRLSLLSIQNKVFDFRSSELDRKEEAAENSLSSLTSVDLAQATSELVRLQIQQQAQITAMAQANTQARAVLALLSP
jgi:flagellin-like hook-associated protein FlgL